MDSEDQLAAAQMTAIKTLLDQAQEEATPLVEWALTPKGHNKSKLAPVIAAASGLGSCFSSKHGQICGTVQLFEHRRVRSRPVHVMEKLGLINLKCHHCK